MNRLRSAIAVLVAASVLAGLAVLAQPAPPVARANVGCSVVTAPEGAVAAAMFVMALLEAVVQGSWAVLGKAVFISVPLAFVGTSIAFVLVQLMLVVTDGMSHAVTVATQEHSTHFFKAAIGDLAKADGKA